MAMLMAGSIAMGEFVCISATYTQTWSAKPVYVLESHTADCLRNVPLRSDEVWIGTQDVAFYRRREVLIVKADHDPGHKGGIVMFRLR
jgi:hypothetical protein